MITQNIEYVDTDEKLGEVVEHLIVQENEIALDFECEFNLHRYGMHLCLIQLFDGTTCYLIDPVLINNLNEMKRIFASKIEKVMFAAKGDLCLLDHCYQFRMRNVYDVQIAAQALEIEQLSLGNVTEHFLGIKLNKSKSKQRANWNRRPLTSDLIEYAADDVIYLLELKAVVAAELDKVGGEPKAFVKKWNKKLEKVRFKQHPNPHLKIKKSSTLNHHQKKYLKEFYNLRDKISRELDLSPNNLMNNEVLISISRKVPRTRNEWKNLKGLNRRLFPYLDRFIEAKQKMDKDSPRKAVSEY